MEILLRRGFPVTAHLCFATHYLGVAMSCTAGFWDLSGDVWDLNCQVLGVVDLQLKKLIES